MYLIKVKGMEYSIFLYFCQMVFSCHWNILQKTKNGLFPRECPSPSLRKEGDGVVLAFRPLPHRNALDQGTHCLLDLHQGGRIGADARVVRANVAVTDADTRVGAAVVADRDDQRVVAGARNRDPQLGGQSAAQASAVIDLDARREDVHRIERTFRYRHELVGHIDRGQVALRVSTRVAQSALVAELATKGGVACADRYASAFVAHAVVVACVRQAQVDGVEFANAGTVVGVAGVAVEASVANVTGGTDADDDAGVVVADTMLVAVRTVDVAHLVQDAYRSVGVVAGIAISTGVTGVTQVAGADDDAAGVVAGSVVVAAIRRADFIQDASSGSIIMVTVVASVAYGADVARVAGADREASSVVAGADFAAGASVARAVLIGIAAAESIIVEIDVAGIAGVAQVTDGAVTYDDAGVVGTSSNFAAGASVARAGFVRRAAAESIFMVVDIAHIAGQTRESEVAGAFDHAAGVVAGADEVAAIRRALFVDDAVRILKMVSRIAVIAVVAGVTSVALTGNRAEVIRAEAVEVAAVGRAFFVHFAQVSVGVVAGIALVACAAGVAGIACANRNARAVDAGAVLVAGVGLAVDVDDAEVAVFVVASRAVTTRVAGVARVACADDYAADVVAGASVAAIRRADFVQGAEEVVVFVVAVGAVVAVVALEAFEAFADGQTGVVVAVSVVLAESSAAADVSHAPGSLEMESRGAEFAVGTGVAFVAATVGDAGVVVADTALGAGVNVTHLIEFAVVANCVVVVFALGAEDAAVAHVAQAFDAAGVVVALAMLRTRVQRADLVHDAGLVFYVVVRSAVATEVTGVARITGAADDAGIYDVAVPMVVAGGAVIVTGSVHDADVAVDVEAIGAEFALIAGVALEASAERKSGVVAAVAVAIAESDGAGDVGCTGHVAVVVEFIRALCAELTGVAFVALTGDDAVWGGAESVLVARTEVAFLVRNAAVFGGVEAFITGFAVNAGVTGVAHASREAIFDGALAVLVARGDEAGVVDRAVHAVDVVTGGALFAEASVEAITAFAYDQAFRNRAVSVGVAAIRAAGLVLFAEALVVVETVGAEFALVAGVAFVAATLGDSFVDGAVAIAGTRIVRAGLVNDARVVLAVVTLGAVLA